MEPAAVSICTGGLVVFIDRWSSGLYRQVVLLYRFSSGLYRQVVLVYRWSSSLCRQVVLPYMWSKTYIVVHTYGTYIPLLCLQSPLFFRSSQDCMEVYCNARLSLWLYASSIFSPYTST